MSYIIAIPVKPQDVIIREPRNHEGKTRMSLDVAQSLRTSLQSRGHSGNLNGPIAVDILQEAIDGMPNDTHMPELARMLRDLPPRTYYVYFT